MCNWRFGKNGHRPWLTPFPCWYTARMFIGSFVAETEKKIWGNNSRMYRESSEVIWDDPNWIKKTPALSGYRNSHSTQQFNERFNKKISDATSQLFQHPKSMFRSKTEHTEKTPRQPQRKKIKIRQDNFQLSNFQDSGIDKKSVHDVVLVGGSTRIPKVGRCWPQKHPRWWNKKHPWITWKIPNKNIQCNLIPDLNRFLGTLDIAILNLFGVLC